MAPYGGISSAPSTETATTPTSRRPRQRARALHAHQRGRPRAGDEDRDQRRCTGSASTGAAARVLLAAEDRDDRLGADAQHEREEDAEQCRAPAWCAAVTKFSRTSSSCAATLSTGSTMPTRIAGSATKISVMREEVTKQADLAWAVLEHRHEDHEDPEVEDAQDRRHRERQRGQRQCSQAGARPPRRDEPVPLQQRRRRGQHDRRADQSAPRRTRAGRRRRRRGRRSRPRAPAGAAPR